MSIVPAEKVDDLPVNTNKKCWGARKRMSQAIRSLAKLATSESTREKYKGIVSLSS